MLLSSPVIVIIVGTSYLGTSYLGTSYLGTSYCYYVGTSYLEMNFNKIAPLLHIVLLRFKAQVLELLSSHGLDCQLTFPRAKWVREKLREKKLQYNSLQLGQI